MTIAEAWPTSGRPFTVDDLDRMPEDGHRYELLDGVLVVSPRPSWAHQEVAGALLAQLRQSCPAEMRAFAEPAVQLSAQTEFDPDIVVGDEPFLAERPFAVEVVPSRLVTGLVLG